VWGVKFYPTNIDQCGKAIAKPKELIRIMKKKE